MFNILHYLQKTIFQIPQFFGTSQSLSIFLFQIFYENVRDCSRRICAFTALICRGYTDKREECKHGYFSQVVIVIRILLRGFLYFLLEEFDIY